MAYTSGRTVKSGVSTATTIAKATRDARRLIEKTLPGVAGVTVNSTRTADPVTLDLQIRTTITYPETADASDLACAVERLPGLIRSTWSTVAITIVRAA